MNKNKLLPIFTAVAMFLTSVVKADPANQSTAFVDAPIDENDVPTQCAIASKPEECRDILNVNRAVQTIALYNQMRIDDILNDHDNSWPTYGDLIKKSFGSGGMPTEILGQLDMFLRPALSYAQKKCLQQNAVLGRMMEKDGNVGKYAQQQREELNNRYGLDLCSDVPLEGNPVNLSIKPGLSPQFLRGPGF